jgi:hypothetical protein
MVAAYSISIFQRHGRRAEAVCALAPIMRGKIAARIDSPAGFQGHFAISRVGSASASRAHGSASRA